jgi:tetraacyldisaccharide 4'-kinase
MKAFLFKPVLKLLSKVYEVALNITQAFYRKRPGAIRKVNAQVISVGNITSGGTGKTPLTIMLAKHLWIRGKRVAVLTRGYGNDEVHELKRCLNDIPLLVGRDRIRLAHLAVEKHQAEIIILDDGFQHIRLHRDHDIVAINATDPFGNGKLLPAGPLREPLKALNRAHIAVITKATLGKNNLTFIKQKLRDINPKIDIFEADHRPLRFMDFNRHREWGLNYIRGKRIGVLTGIEDPISFERSLYRFGAKIVFAARFNDHHQFSKSEIEKILKDCRSERASVVVTTEKDYHRVKDVLEKINSGIRYHLLVLQIEMRMDDEENFLRRFHHL